MTALCETCLPSFAAELRLAVERAEKAEAREQALAEALRKLDRRDRGLGYLTPDYVAEPLAKWEANRDR